MHFPLHMNHPCVIVSLQKRTGMQQGRINITSIMSALQLERITIGPIWFQSLTYILHLIEGFCLL